MLGYCYIFHDIFHVKNVELPAVVVRRRRDLQGPLGGLQSTERSRSKREE